MVRIRLQRVGSKNRPSYRIVVAEKRDPLKGKTQDVIGFYNPLPEKALFKIDVEKYNNYISKGAKPSETVEKLFAKFINTKE
ncbi:30S ribosomal protein S16 [Thermodesulfobium narugense DSM 14796]|uniref:Small ribosomal subunit protein bS16 n=1 Tax=Thermodesulfobium narugense DSM 14796 TaxID=747365 RepID=M1E632_9BACT|nr:30S ribosomal protein S16 [Thermodesulfobium narugense]AEE14616.1 30S ribosomal protein S16 [Thermodesulfobium narugense DSM 14796]